MRPFITAIFLLYCGVALPALACSPTKEAFERGEALERFFTDWKGAHVLGGTLLANGNVVGLADFEKALGSCSVFSPKSGFLVRALADAEYAIIGEMHDNAEHHRFRAKLVEWLSVSKKSIVFEQFRADQQPALDAFAALQTKSPDQATLPQFKRLTDWEKSGWQQYNYDPLLQAALDAKLPIYAGDVTRDSIMKVAKDGEGELPADKRARLKLDVPLGDALEQASITEIEEAHCGAMPREAFNGMAFAQRFRDASLSDALLKAAEKHGSAVMVAGNGHVRTDRGVPWYIRQRAPDKKVVSVMLIEVEDGKVDPASYVPRDPDGKPAADYIIFTPRAVRDDPCVEMRAKMKK